MQSDPKKGLGGNQILNQELIRRIGFLFGAILVFRIGVHVPVPGIDPLKLAEMFNQNKNTILGLFNMFSGGALQRLSIFALGIMPYITASIVVQMLTVVYPPFEELKKEGEAGRKKINQYTRYGALVLSSFQSIGVSKFLVASGIALSSGYDFYFVACLTLVTGTLFLMWLGEQVTERGIGNGISMLIFAGIVAGIPSALGKTFEQVKEGQLNILVLMTVLLLLVGVTFLVVFIEKAQRRIPIHYARKTQGRGQSYASQTTHLPLKLNMAGVIPPIFASAIIMFPATIGQLFGHSPYFSWLSRLSLALSPGQPVYMLVMSVAILLFAFFYTALIFNPKDTADNLKRSGALIPGIRPGEHTMKYIDQVMTRLTLFGALYLVLISMVPEFFIYAWNVPFYFGGTSLLIVVVVVMDFWAQVQAHLMSQQYASLMKKASLRKK